MNASIAPRAGWLAAVVALALLLAAVLAAPAGAAVAQPCGGVAQITDPNGDGRDGRASDEDGCWQDAFSDVHGWLLILWYGVRVHPDRCAEFIIGVGTIGRLARFIGIDQRRESPPMPSHGMA